MNGCMNCGKETTKVGSRHKKYCNLDCKYAYESKSRKKVYAEIECLVCKSIFTPCSFVNKLCSIGCKRKYEIAKRSKKPKSKNCSFCSLEFKPYTSLDKFCSAACRIENEKPKRSKRWNEVSVSKRMGTNNPGYKHGLAVMGAKKDSTGMKRYLKIRDEYKAEFIENNGSLYCERCGTTSGKVETHHIVFRSEKPNHEHIHDKRNLLIVCVPCHNWYHKSKGNRDLLVNQRQLQDLFGIDILDKSKELIEAHNKRIKS